MCKTQNCYKAANKSVKVLFFEFYISGSSLLFWRFVLALVFLILIISDGLKIISYMNFTKNSSNTISKIVLQPHFQNCSINMYIYVYYTYIFMAFLLWHFELDNINRWKLFEKQLSILLWFYQWRKEYFRYLKLLVCFIDWLLRQSSTRNQAFLQKWFYSIFDLTTR